VSYASGGEPAQGAAYAQALQKQVTAKHDPYGPCAGYYPLGPCQYVVEYRHRNGEVADRARTTVQFFAAPKPLRP